MNNKKKRFWIVSIFLILLILGISFHHFHEQKKTLTIGIYASSSWNVPNGQQYHVIDYAIQKFKHEHPDVTVKYENGIQLEDYRNWVSEKIIENKMPDLVIVPNKDFNLLASEGAFKSLTSLMHYDKISPNIFYSSTLKAGQYNNQQLALPYEANPTLMVMNKTLLKKLHISPPQSNWTPQKFYQICHQINHKRKKGRYYGVTSSYSWQDAQLAYGSNLFSKSDNGIQLTSSKVRRGFSLSEDLSNDTSSDNVTSQLFDKGRVAFMPIGLAQYRTYTSYPFYVTRANNFLWECTKMPGNLRIKSTPIETSMFAISSKAQNPEMAWQFMKLLCTNKNVQQELMRTNMGSSVLPSVVKSHKAQEILDNKVINYHKLTVKKLDEIMQNGAVNPKFKDYNTTWEKLDYKIQNALKAGNLETQLFNIQLQVNQNKEK